MKFANCAGRACIVRDDRLLDIGTASDGALSSDPAIYLAVDTHRELAALADLRRDDFVDYSATDLGPPVPRPGTIIAVALNYQLHADEAGRTVPDQPVFFTKSSGSVCGPTDTIQIATDWQSIDYEAEVVAVVGRRTRDVTPDDAWNHLAGLTAGQDISDRAEQSREPLRQFSFAKSYDTFSPIGPVLVSIDEFADPDDVELIGRVDGNEVQHATTKALIASIPQLISQISQRITLEPGDLIFTGTPGGVGSRRQPPLFLRPGMTLETEIPQVGKMVNRIRERTNNPDDGATVSHKEPAR